MLQVQPDAPFETIRSSYITLFQKLTQNPNLGGDHWNATVINEAFQTLRDEAKRAEYDKELFQNYTKNFSSEEKEKKQLVTIVSCLFCKKPLVLKDHSDKNCLCINNPFHTENQDRKRERSTRFLNHTKKLGKLHFMTAALKEVYEGQMVDLSPTGIRFICNKALIQNEIIKIYSPLFRAIAEINGSQKRVKDGKVSYSTDAHFESASFTDQEETLISASA